MGCPALGIWVAFLKQPVALHGRAPQKNKNKIFELLLIQLWFFFVWGASPGSTGCFKKATQNWGFWVAFF
jgi:hypothetical protein